MEQAQKIIAGIAGLAAAYVAAVVSAHQPKQMTQPYTPKVIVYSRDNYGCVTKHTQDLEKLK